MSKKKRKSKVFCVLGMHRSATSLTAKALHEQENVTMGDELIGAGPGNEKGHFEDTDFVGLNQQILKSAGGSWRNPPHKKDILAVKDDYEEEIISLIERKEGGLWGWKDPRTSLTIPLYWEHLTNPHLIVNFREPQKVAESLHAREPYISVEEGKSLAREYNKRILDFIEGKMCRVL